MNSQGKSVFPLIVGAFFVVLLGIVTAYFLSTKVLKAPGSSSKGAPGVKVTSTEAGSLDPSIKYDTATGVLKEGGINGEGTYHLERDGGVSKNVYLTSSMIDLGQFVGKNVEVWGETLASKKAGWLMDIAKIQVAK